MRVWERGAGETLSSGSGSSATAVAAIVNGRAVSPVVVHLDGGDLTIEVGRRPRGAPDRAGRADPPRRVQRRVRRRAGGAL